MANISLGIVEWVKQTVKQVELSEKEQKAALHAEHACLMDVQRQYAAALKRLAGGEAQNGEYRLRKIGIVEWLNHTVKKVEVKYRSEKDQKVRVEYARLIDVQRQYAVALKWLAESRRLASGEALT